MLPCYPTPNPQAGTSKVGQPQAGDPNPATAPMLPATSMLPSAPMLPATSMLPSAPMLPAADDAAAPQPIGPERLRALREAILSGAYPGEVAVTDGLTSLLRKPGPRSGESAPPPGKPA